MNLIVQHIKLAEFSCTPTKNIQEFEIKIPSHCKKIIKIYYNIKDVPSYATATPYIAKPVVGYFNININNAKEFSCFTILPHRVSTNSTLYRKLLANPLKPLEFVQDIEKNTIVAGTFENMANVFRIQAPPVYVNFSISFFLECLAERNCVTPIPA